VTATARSRTQGASLIELIVASFVVGLLMLEVWGLVAAGGRFYRKARSQGEVQRNSLFAMRWIAKDLAGGSTISFREYSPDATVPPAYPGIVFGSPVRPQDGQVHYNSSGRMQWGSVVGYYIDPSDSSLYRQQIALADQSLTFPPIIDNDAHSTDIMAGLPRPRLVARQINTIETQQGPTDIKIELSSRDNELGFGIKVQTRLEMKN
jgi:hypothetical protein